MGDAAGRASKPNFSIRAEYVPDRERMLRALLLALGLPVAEIRYLLDERRREVTETASEDEESQEDLEGGDSRVYN